MKEYFLWLAKFLTVVIVVFVMIPVVFILLLGGLAASVNQDKILRPGSKEHKVAVVELSGIILDSRDVIDELYRQVDDPSIKGVVLRIDSPGGAVGPSQEIYNTVRKLKSRKPVVASMAAVAASGGLYAALGASKILAQPGTQTGSIGVIVQFPNLTEIAQKLGFQMVTVKSGKLKDVGNPFKSLNDEEFEYLNVTVKRSHEDFIQAVVDGRSIEIEKVRGFADGRMILGRDAKDLSLIDEIGDTMDAARAIFILRGEELPANVDPQLYYPNDKYREFKKFFESASLIPQMVNSRVRLMYLAH